MDGILFGAVLGFANENCWEMLQRIFSNINIQCFFVERGDFCWSFMYEGFIDYDESNQQYSTKKSLFPK